jgi:choline dehydrogenase
MIAEKAADILLGNSPEAPQKVPFFKYTPESRQKQFSN